MSSANVMKVHHEIPITVQLAAVWQLAYHIFGFNFVDKDLLTAAIILP